MSTRTVDRTCSKPVCTVTISECTTEFGMRTSRPSKVRTLVLVSETAATVPATSCTAIWSFTRNLSRARMTMPANMFPGTVWKAMPAAIDSTPMPPRALTGLMLGNTMVSAAAHATSSVNHRMRCANMSLALFERPRHSRTPACHPPGDTGEQPATGDHARAQQHPVNGHRRQDELTRRRPLPQPTSGFAWTRLWHRSLDEQTSANASHPMVDHRSPARRSEVARLQDGGASVSTRGRIVSSTMAATCARSASPCAALTGTAGPQSPAPPHRA